MLKIKNKIAVILLFAVIFILAGIMLDTSAAYAASNKAEFDWDMNNTIKPDNVSFYGDLANVAHPYAENVFGDLSKGSSMKIGNGANPVLNIGTPLPAVGGGEVVSYSFDIGIDKLSIGNGTLPSYFFQIFINGRAFGVSTGISIDHTGRIKFFGQDTGNTIDAGKWHNFRYLLVPSTDNTNLYAYLCVDGVWIFNYTIAVPNAVAGEDYIINYVRFCNNSSESILYVDNIRLVKQMPGNYEVECYFKATGKDAEVKITDDRYNNGTVRARVDVRTNNPEIQVVVVAALYDESNKLLEVSMSDENVLTDDGYVETILDVKDAADTQIKIMVIDSFEEFSPYICAKTLTPYDLCDDVGTDFKVFVNNDFNNSNSLFEGFDANTRGNIFEYAEECDGNGYLFFERIADNMDTFFDAIFDADATMKGLVLSADFSTTGNTPTTRIFSARNGYSSWCHFLLLSSGEIRAANGAIIAELKNNEWVNVALVLDFREKIYDVYRDGKKVVEKAAFPNSGFEKLTSVRTQMLPTVGSEILMIDNVKMYESEVPKDISGVRITPDKRDIFPKASEHISRLSGTVALNLGSDWIFAKNAKKKMDAIPYVSNDRTMIPVRAVTEAFGLEVEWDENECLMTLDGRVTMKVGEKNITLNGKTVEIDAAPEIKDGKIYIPLRALAEQILEKKVFYCDYGLIVISDDEFNYGNSDEELRRLSTYVFSERPDKDAIKQAYDNAGYKNVHPRLHADADKFARLREEYKTNSRIREWTDNAIRLADGVLNQPPLGFVLDSNGRLLHTSRAVQDRLLNLGYAYQITGNKKYAERVWKEMEGACLCPHWNPGHFLDTAEMAYGVALGYDWCYDYLTKEQRSFIEEGILNLGLQEGINQYNGNPKEVNFVFRDMNWNAVCNGGLSAAALAIMDVYPEETVYTIQKALRSFEYMMTEFAPDGGWIEGPMYWGYMMKYFCLWMDCMNSVLGTDFNVPNYPGISKTGNATFALQGNDGSNNFNDAGDGDVISPELMWLGRYFKNDGLTSAYLSFMDLKNKTGTVYDCLYYDTNINGGLIDMPLDNVTRDVETGSMRSNWDSLDGTYLGYRAGKANVNHYHLSEGAFVFDALGVRWAMDLGGDSIIYTPNFSQRNNLYRVRPEGHNCVVINPSKDPGQDMGAFCPIIKSESKPKGAYQVVDLFSAYKNYTSDYLRGYMFTDDRRTAVIRDEFTLLNQSEAYWFMHTRADIEIVSEDTAILTRNGKRLQFKMIVEGADAELKVMPAEPLPTTPAVEGQASNKGINKIAIYMRGNGKVSVSVRMTPADSYMAEETFVCSEIAGWTIPDGEQTVVFNQ